MPNVQKSYSHVKKAERLEIAILLKKGYSYSDIANALGRGKSTISEEISNNKVRGKYDPLKADQKAKTRRKNSKYQGMKIASHLKLRDYVEEKIRDDWSPEEIAGRLKNVDDYLPYVSYLGVYKFVHSHYGGYALEKHLRHSKKRKKYLSLTKLTNRVFIDQRPLIIEEKQRFYDWEGDFIVSGKNGFGSLLVLYERKSQLVVIKKITNRSPKLVNQIFKEITGGELHFNSLTLDNDIAFRKHPLLSKIIGAPIYFCHPYHSWEKGGVENINKLIRQYIHKRSDISKYSEEYILKVQTKLNNRPRKNLGYKTPLEVLRENNEFQPLKYFTTINLNLTKQKTAQTVRLEG
jgi:transposase, IS30 family